MPTDWLLGNQGEGIKMGLKTKVLTLKGNSAEFISNGKYSLLENVSKLSYEYVSLVPVTGPPPMHKGFMSIEIHHGVQASGRYKPDLTRNPEMFRMGLLCSTIAQ